jgi:hypothetical protein
MAALVKDTPLHRFGTPEYFFPDNARVVHVFEAGSHLLARRLFAPSTQSHEFFLQRGRACYARGSSDRQRATLVGAKLSKDEYKTARVIGQLEAAQDPHQIVNLPQGGGPARFKVLLHAQTSKESQDDTG